MDHTFEIAKKLIPNFEITERKFFNFFKKLSKFYLLFFQFWDFHKLSIFFRFSTKNHSYS